MVSIVTKLLYLINIFHSQMNLGFSIYSISIILMHIQNLIDRFTVDKELLLYNN